MEAADILRKLTGFADIPTAAKILANRVRARVAEPLFLRDADELVPYSTPVSLELLKEIGRACGIQRVEFGATLASEGELQPRTQGGFIARILRASYASRARFTLAHEIAHTFFYDQDRRPPRRLVPYSRADAFGLNRRCSAANEEWFCNEFAFELLLPEGAGTHLVDDVSEDLSPAEILFAIERFQRRHRTSIQTVVQRLNQANAIPSNLLVVVLRRLSHVKTKQDVAVRVSSFSPRPAKTWFLPRNRRAASIGLRGADALFEWWRTFPDQEPEKEYKNRSGIFCIDETHGDFVIYENEPIPRGHCYERVSVHGRASSDLPWKKLEVEVPVTYRFYAMNVAEAFCLALIDFSRVSQTPHESLAAASGGTSGEIADAVSLFGAR
jgi:hypothetical protein